MRPRLKSCKRNDCKSTTLDSRAGVGKVKRGILHMLRVGRTVAAHCAQEREHMLADHGVHLGVREVVEARPAQVVVVAALGILAFG